MQSRIGWLWSREDMRDAATGERYECWVAEVPGLRYPSGELVIVKALHTGKGWWVDDNRGAFDTSKAPCGVIGTLLAHLENFTEVQMSGDGHFYIEIIDLPKRSLIARIERAAILVAAYSVLLAHVHPPPGWPPQLTITMTATEAAQLGLL
jgi:hypothetical protein